LNARVVQLLLERGADPNIRNDNGKTALWLALQVGCHDPKKGLPVIKLLLEAGADVNIRDNEGQTPLQWAVSYTCPKKEVADLLLSYARRKK
jgi:ankyrin repeat protein